MPGVIHLSRQVFDCTLGFLGDGPTLANQFLTSEIRSLLSILLSGFPSSFDFAFWIFPHSLFFVPATWIAAVLGGVLCILSGYPWGLWIFVCLLALASGAQAMSMFLRTAGGRSKAALRLNRLHVALKRPVLPAIMQHRKQLQGEFLFWAFEQGLGIAAVFEDHQRHFDDLNLVSEKFGSAMYDHGKIYGKYAETLNAITSWKPAVRQIVQRAGVLGFAWSRYGPSLHHVAMPGPFALAILTTKMLWGWTHFAGFFILLSCGQAYLGQLDCLQPIGLTSYCPVEVTKHFHLDYWRYVSRNQVLECASSER